MAKYAYGLGRLSSSNAAAERDSDGREGRRHGGRHCREDGRVGRRLLYQQVMVELILILYIQTDQTIKDSILLVMQVIQHHMPMGILKEMAQISVGKGLR